MQNQNTFVLDFALPRRRVIYPKSLQAERNAKSGKLAFWILTLPRRRVIYPKSLQAERNAKSGKLVF